MRSRPTMQRATTQKPAREDELPTKAARRGPVLSSPLTNSLPSSRCSWRRLGGSICVVAAAVSDDAVRRDDLALVRAKGEWHFIPESNEWCQMCSYRRVRRSRPLGMAPLCALQTKTRHARSVIAGTLLVSKAKVVAKPRAANPGAPDEMWHRKSPFTCLSLLF